MRNPSADELRAIAALLSIPEGDRTMQQLNRASFAILPNSPALPIIHQVLGE